MEIAKPGGEEPLVPLQQIREKVIGLLETLAEAFQHLSQIDAQRSEPFGRLADKFMADLSAIRQQVHGHIMKLGADFRMEDQCSEQLLRAEVSVQKLTYIHGVVQSTLKDLREMQKT
mmetsp:Transcript_798/g.2582  ORF Transcript_798/g.2582 Transcript_798/m.2582 type:complete len:117 (+) Transcript_798:89-439(+)|eukprot:CAMPEP_0198728658 /NCGR_PEP_ID=MMETSP1475-20131203/10714_1 /TAXON_ID= ORGANISM="Unidentified sp., Strain CCMP1999" /NCGR_SAMPLE_ID=MMETSP1475 /ASSEMBLY_ACC=CAM_ASM_001111 /LENGTH=116 /DNA_ID=CAMNT_0044491095 /DNA_START=59 /DNA_END=409 /DNA_ORIENTATION=+